MSCNPIYPEESIQMIGAVFCGGKSTRMGTDKGLIKKDGESWAEIAAKKIEGLAIPVCFSVNQDQFKNYSNLFGEEFLVKDSVSIHGPLAGLLSVHNIYPHHDLLILACDLTDIPTKLLDILVTELRNREGEHDFFVFSNKGNLEPLLGIYTREGLQKLADLFTLNQLEKHSMKYALEIGNTFSIELQETDQTFFANYNSQESIKY